MKKHHPPSGKGIAVRVLGYSMAFIAVIGIRDNNEQVRATPIADLIVGDVVANQMCGAAENLIRKQVD